VKRRVIWWIRRDLRLQDNQALLCALEQAAEVIPVFILDPHLTASPYVGEKRLAFLSAGLRSLNDRLAQLKSYLVLRSGDPLEELTRLFQESGADAIFAEADISSYARRRDSAISQALPIEWCGSPAFRPPGTLLKPDGAPYTIFTPFSRLWKALPGWSDDWLAQTPSHIETPPGIPSLAIPITPMQPSNTGFIAGEDSAQNLLEDFIQSGSVFQYATGRDRLDLDTTAHLSPYLRFGMLSPRRVVFEAMCSIQRAPGESARLSAETWLNELIWRDFYIHILYHFPHVRRENFRLKHVLWENNETHFSAWCAGCTGYPVVDAAMRQLVQTGWMHNRARMIVASFLSKDLLVDWRWGERFFMQHLVDGDPASNNGGWQWTAGTGTDAAPYFRILNPVSQSKKHDPQGVFIRRWLPELASVPGEYIHQPWLMPSSVQLAVGCQLGRDFPLPIVDHAHARERCLHAYQKK
jgi:deoxyribodipyrimidine photo-lyase